MAPGKVGLENPAGGIKWLAGIGLDVSTGKSLWVVARQDINIMAGEQVEVYALERITAGKAGAASSVDMVGNEIHMAATNGVNLASRVNRYRGARLPERLPGFGIDDTCARLSSAFPVVLDARGQQG